MHQHERPQWRCCRCWWNSYFWEPDVCRGVCCVFSVGFPCEQLISFFFLFRSHDSLRAEIWASVTDKPGFTLAMWVIFLELWVSVCVCVSVCLSVWWGQVHVGLPATSKPFRCCEIVMKCTVHSVCLIRLKFRPWTAFLDWKNKYVIRPGQQLLHSVCLKWKTISAIWNCKLLLQFELYQLIQQSDTINYNSNLNLYTLQQLFKTGAHQQQLQIKSLNITLPIWLKLWRQQFDTE